MAATRDRWVSCGALPKLTSGANLLEFKSSSGERNRLGDPGRGRRRRPPSKPPATEAEGAERVPSAFFAAGSFVIALRFYSGSGRLLAFGKGSLGAG